jgi:FkbM family methyltransferase
MYSQNNEEEIIMNYFQGRTGTLLDIGANDGITLSNSYALVQNGWRAVLVEPSYNAYIRMLETHKGKDGQVIMFNAGIAKTTGLQPFFESGPYQGKGPDTALLSTMNAGELARWKGEVVFTECEAYFFTLADFLTDLRSAGPYQKFNFVNIDAEGVDYDILQQMEFIDLQPECICIEHNGKPDLIAGYVELCKRMGLRELARNAENLIFVR